MSSFSSVGALRPGRSFFNLSYSKKFNCGMGKLIPIMCDEVVPGDVVKIGNDFTVRFEPMIAPVMQDIWMKVRYFFVPYRLLHRDCLETPGDTFDWEDFLSQGKDGKTITQVLPRWIPTDNSKYSLWDYLGFPVGVSPAGAYPLNFPREAYNFIWNSWFKNESIDDDVSLDNEDILLARWNRDYFTSCLPFQQKGTAPVMTGDIMYLGSDDAYHSVNLVDYKYGIGGSAEQGYIVGRNADNSQSGDALRTVLGSAISGGVGIVGVSELPKSGSSPVVYGGFNIAQLRLCIQTQKWLERNARAGTRYTELLRAHFGVAPTDARLDRPEYIGGSKTPIIVSEVLQTSSTDATSPQGTMAGHGISIDRNYVAKYRVEEYGLIMGLACIAPKHEYASQGINRQWLRRDRLDFYFPEFAHLSEQGVETAEIYATNVEADNTDLFGYIGRYDEMRHKQSMVCADFRDNYKDWTLNDFYASKPLLNSSFIEADVDTRIFAVPTYPQVKVNFGNVIHAYRPLPLVGEPGLVDHF